MVIRKRSTTRKRKTRRSRKMTMTRVPRQGSMNVVRTFWYENWTPSTVTTANFWKYYAFRFSDIPQYTEYSAIFDQYRINAVKVTFRPRYDNFAGNDTTDTTLPGVTNQGLTTAHIINDPYSQLVPSGVYSSANLNIFLENGRVRSYTGVKPFSVYLKPTIYETVSATNTARIKRAPFLMCQDGFNAAHRGFHIFLQDINLTGVFGQSFDVFYTYYLTLKGMR